MNDKKIRFILLEDIFIIIIILIVWEFFLIGLSLFWRADLIGYIVTLLIMLMLFICGYYGINWGDKK